MENELKCWNCKSFFINPILLPCSHSMCLSCALAVQTPYQPLAAAGCSTPGSATTAPHLTTDDVISVCGGSDQGDAESVDKVSLVSETDSGVVCSRFDGKSFLHSSPNRQPNFSSRPSSLVYPTSRSSAILALSTLAPTRFAAGGLALPSVSLVCPQCQQVCHFDESGAHGAPRNKALANIVLRSTPSFPHFSQIHKPAV